MYPWPQYGVEFYAHEAIHTKGAPRIYSNNKGSDPEVHPCSPVKAFLGRKTNVLDFGGNQRLDFGGNQRLDFGGKNFIDPSIDW